MSKYSSIAPESAPAMLLTALDFVLLGYNIVLAVADNMGIATNVQNVNFDVYFDQEGSKVYEKQIDVSSEDTIILHIDVSGLQHIPYFYKESDPEYAVQMQDAYMNYIEFSMALAAEGLIIANGGKTYLPYGSIGILDDALDVYDRVFREYE